MLASDRHAPDPLTRLSQHHRKWCAYLAKAFPALDGDAIEDLVQDAYASPSTVSRFPHAATDAELAGWFRMVLRHDAIDYMRRVNGLRAAEPVPRPLSLDDLQTRLGEGYAARPLTSVDERGGLAAVERADEVVTLRRTIDAALQQADPETARLLRAKLAGEKPAAIARREGWHRKRYERQLTRAYKEMHAILAAIESGPHCRSIRDLLLESNTALLTVETRRRVGVHVESCVHCKAYRRNLRKRIAALIPWPIPIFIGRVLGRGAAADLAGAGAGAGGAAGAGLLAAAGGKTAAALCATALIGGGCITFAAVKRDHSPPTTPGPPLAGSPSVGAASSGTPLLGITVPALRPPTSRTSTSSTRRRTEQERDRRGRGRDRDRDAAKQRAATAASGGEGEFGPQTTASNPVATPRPVVTSTPRAASMNAPSAPSHQRPTAPKPATPPSSSFSNEFSP